MSRSGGGAAAGRLSSRPATGASADALSAGSTGPGPGVHRLAGGAAAPRTAGTGQPADAMLLVPPGDRAPRPLLVFFHGAGGRAEHSLAQIEPAVTQAGVLALLPSSAGPTWDLITGDAGLDVAALDTWLAAVFARHPVRGVAFAGFSDGASYALSLGLCNGDLVDNVLAFSPGFAAPPSRHGRPRVWVSHGTRDDVLPVEPCGRTVVRTIAETGYEVRYEEFDGGHVIRAQDLTNAFAWWLAL